MVIINLGDAGEYQSRCYDLQGISTGTIDSDTLVFNRLRFLSFFDKHAKIINIWVYWICIMKKSKRSESKVNGVSDDLPQETTCGLSESSKTGVDQYPPQGSRLIFDKTIRKSPRISPDSPQKFSTSPFDVVQCPDSTETRQANIVGFSGSNPKDEQIKSSNRKSFILNDKESKKIRARRTGIASVSVKVGTVDSTTPLECHSPHVLIDDNTSDSSSYLEDSENSDNFFTDKANDYLSYSSRLISESSESIKVAGKRLKVQTLVIARVYKRYIFATAIITLILSYFLFPILFFSNGRLTVVLPDQMMSRLSQLILESALTKPSRNADLWMRPMAAWERFLNGGRTIISSKSYSYTLWGERYISSASAFFRGHVIRPVWDKITQALAVAADFGTDDPTAPGKRMRDVHKARPKHPVVMLPGATSTGLELWEGRTCATPFFRQHFWGTFTMLRIMITDPECWVTHLKLDSSKGGADPHGIKLRPAQGLDAADFVLPGFWVWSRLIENLALIGYDSNNLAMAAYDWRLDFARLEERDGYFTRLKHQIEAFRTLNKEKVVVLAQSLGGVVWLYFMRWVENFSSGWVENHIHAFVPIGTAFLGCPKTLSVYLTAEDAQTARLGSLEATLLEKILSQRDRLALFRSWPSLASLLPRGGSAIWGDGSVNGTRAVDLPDGVEPYGIININGHDPIETLDSYSNFDVDKPKTMNQANACKLDKSGGMGGSTVDCPIHQFDKNSFSITKQVDCSSTSGEHNFLINADHIDTILHAFMPDAIAERTEKVYGWSTNSHWASPDEAVTNDSRSETWANPLQARLPNAPSMTIYCFYGVGKETERGYEYVPVPVSESASGGIPPRPLHSGCTCSSAPIFSQDMRVDEKFPDKLNSHNEKFINSSGTDSNESTKTTYVDDNCLFCSSQKSINMMNKSDSDHQIEFDSSELIREKIKRSFSNGSKSISRDEYARRTRTDDASSMLLRFKMNTSKTSEALKLRNGVHLVDGDGVIPTISCGFMPVHGWRKLHHLNPANITVVTREYLHRPYTAAPLSALKFSPTDASHCGIMGNHEMMWDILSIVSETPISAEEKQAVEAVELSISDPISLSSTEDEDLVYILQPPSDEYTLPGIPVKERFYSRIREMSAQIQIPGNV